MYTTIYLHGSLRKKYGKEFRCVAHSTKDCVRFLEVNFKDFRQFILDETGKGTFFKVRHGNYEIGEDELSDPIVKDKSVHITALPSGAGKVGKIILGTALIAGGLIFSGGLLGLSAVQLIVTGSLLLVSGLMGLKPKNDADKENEKSFIFSGVSNTAEIGQRIYVVYGVMLAPSMVLSATVRSYITATNVGGS
jgi:predicted phage tail protein